MLYVMGFLGATPSYQTLQIISLREQLGYEEELCVKTVGEMQNIMASAENELILQTGSGTFQL